MPAEYDLTPAARQDVRDIWLSTAEPWGERQADRYTGFLETCFRRIAGKKARSKTFSERYPQAQVTRCQHHELGIEPTFAKADDKSIQPLSKALSMSPA